MKTNVLNKELQYLLWQRQYHQYRYMNNQDSTLKDTMTILKYKISNFRLMYLHMLYPLQISMFVSHSVLPDSLPPHGLQPTKLLCPWNSPGKNTGMGCSFLLQVIFPIKRWNSGLLHCRQILNHLSRQGSPLWISNISLTFTLE